MNKIAKIFMGNQPEGLPSLFMVELWERFGFYAVQTVLVLYLTKVFHLSDSTTYSVFSITSSFLYATPFIGGFLADKIIGQRNSILLGAVVLCIGYCLLMISKLIAFYWAISFIIIGNGFFKSSVSILVGELYSQNDSRRDAGFTIFYMGINLGSVFGPFMAGFVSRYFGWSYVFGVTAAGLVISFYLACMAFKILGNRGLPPVSKPIKFLNHTISPYYLLVCGIILTVFILSILIQHDDIANVVFLIFCVLVMISVGFLAARNQGVERYNMIVLTTLILFSIIFWAIYNQTYSSLNLFTDRLVDRHLLYGEIPTAVFQSVNPFFIVVLTPFLVKFWPYSEKKQWWITSAAAKFSAALFFLAFGFGVLLLGIAWREANNQVSMFWVILNYFLQTFGELCLSPIGLSLVTQLAPIRFRGMMMGVWLLSTAAGFSLGNWLSQCSSIPDELLKKQNTLQMLSYYQHAFTIYIWLAIISGVILFICVPFLNGLLKKHERCVDKPLFMEKNV